MINAKDWLEFGQKFHGHKCPAMPMGLRVGAAAMNKLGVERTGDGDIIAVLELGEDHCATCFADGIQVITGCTYGKGNITKTHKGKWGVTLIEKKTKRAVRITPTATAMMANKKSPFFTEYRGKGVPATKVPPEVVNPLVDRVMTLAEKDLFNITEVFQSKFEEKPHSFNGFVCEECGEMTVMEYGRVKGDKKVCIDCAEKN